MHLAALFAYPDRERRAPVTVTGKPPVDDVFQKVAHAPRFDGFGHPMHGVVGGDEFVFDRGHFDKPTFARIIQERRVAAPAMGITVLVYHFLKEESLVFEHGDDGFIPFLYEHARKVFCGGHKTAALVHEVDDGKFVFSAHAVVVLAERGRDVHDARAVGQGHVAVAHDVVRLFAERAERVVEERLVFRIFVFFAQQICSGSSPRPSRKS